MVDHEYLIPKSPLSFNSPAYKSSNILPPLKFHSSLLGSHNLETNSFNDYEDDDYDYDHDESVGSASDDMDCTFSEGEEFNEEMLNVDPIKAHVPIGLNKSTLNRGIINKNLCVEVPQKMRKFTETGWNDGASTRLSAYVSLTFLISYGC